MFPKYSYYRMIRKARRKALAEAQLARTNNPDLADIIEQNIEQIVELHESLERGKCLQDKVADNITLFSGSMGFVYLHALWFIAWVIVNTGHAWVKPFDPYPFNFLTMIVSLEAIFLSTFVLLSQNRMQALADQRAELDLQINLLSEHEITRVLKLVDAIADHFGIEEAADPEIEALKSSPTPKAVLDEFELRKKQAKSRRNV